MKYDLFKFFNIKSIEIPNIVLSFTFEKNQLIEKDRVVKKLDLIKLRHIHI
jgi:hypothetical protein